MRILVLEGSSLAYRDLTKTAQHGHVKAWLPNLRSAVSGYRPDTGDYWTANEHKKWFIGYRSVACTNACQAEFPNRAMGPKHLIKQLMSLLFDAWDAYV